MIKTKTDKYGKLYVFIKNKRTYDTIKLWALVRYV